MRPCQNSRATKKELRLRLKRIAIVGAGGMAREVKALIAEINRVERGWEFAGYVVSDLTLLGSHDSREEVVGDFEKAALLTQGQTSLGASLWDEGCS